MKWWHQAPYLDLISFVLTLIKSMIQKGKFLLTAPVPAGDFVEEKGEYSAFYQSLVHVQYLHGSLICNRSVSSLLGGAWQ